MIVPVGTSQPHMMRGDSFTDNNDNVAQLSSGNETRTTPAAAAPQSIVQKQHILSGTRQLKQSNSVLAG